MTASTPAHATSDAPVGRRFTGRRKVRLGDATADGRLRFDALTRYTQDVSDDDTTDAGLSPDLGWVVRRTTVTVDQHARLGEELSFTTYCSALGKRWADRRLDIEGSDGARLTVVTLWICVDIAAARPAPLSDQFLDIYGSAAQGRAVSARLRLPKMPTEGTATWRWPLRVVDVDTQRHVNNAAYWAVLEEALGGEAPDGAHEACVEYGAGLTLDDEVTVHHAEIDGSRLWWLVNAEGEMAASISLAIPAGR